MEPFDSAYLQKQLANHFNHIKNLSLKRFKHTTLAEEAESYALEKLMENNWQRLKSFRAESSFKTFFTVTVTRLFEDFSRKKFGRMDRVPQWITDLGALWIKTFKLHCLEKFTRDDIIEMLATDPQSVWSRQDVDRAISVISGKIVNCGKVTGESGVPFDEIESYEFAESEGKQHQRHADQILSECERTYILEQIKALLTKSTPSAPPGSYGNPRICDSAKDFLSRCKLTDEDRLFLRLIFQEGMSMSRAGSMLGWDRSKSSRTYNRLLQLIRKAGKASGLFAEVNNSFLNL